LTSLDALMLYYFAFLMQQLKRQEEYLVSSRRPVLLFCFSLDLCAQPGST
jgi:hypothetical protein